MYVHNCGHVLAACICPVSKWLFVWLLLLVMLDQNFFTVREGYIFNSIEITVTLKFKLLRLFIFLKLFERVVDT